VRKRTSHDNNLAHRIDDPRLFAQRNCDICQWCDGDQRDLAGMLQDFADDQIDAMFRADRCG
jgi:hypothetical protein